MSESDIVEGNVIPHHPDDGKKPNVGEKRLVIDDWVVSSEGCEVGDADARALVPWMAVQDPKRRGSFKVTREF